ncbi:MAG: epimerase, partial [Gemmatimonadota bacterium]|nr:epimerase [Gemmatimonadota bacterium]
MSQPFNRRDFLRTAGGGALGLGLIGRAGSAQEPASDGAAGARRGRAASVLVLGGTGFIGPYQVRACLAEGHDVTIFNRGNRPGLFEGVEELIGDRNGDYEALRGRRWDVVIDNSTARPDWVRMACEVLRDSVERYYYVSSRSAYADHSTVPMHAGVPTHTYETAGVDPATADIADLPYGLAKAESERIVMRHYPDGHGIFRPGLIIGPDDPTDRFTYWPVRIHRGGEVLSPGDRSDPVQIIDVRDLGDFMALSAGAGHTGKF